MTSCSLSTKNTNPLNYFLKSVSRTHLKALAGVEHVQAIVLELLKRLQRHDFLEERTHVGATRLYKCVRTERYRIAGMKHQRISVTTCNTPIT